MGDAGDALSLLAGGGGHQGTGSGKEHVFHLSLGQQGQDMAAQHRCRAAAAGTAGVDILLFPVKEEEAAVLVYRLISRLWNR